MSSTPPGQQLADALERELQAGQALQGLLDEERAALLEGTAERVAQVAERKGLLAREIAALGEARNALLSRERLPAGRRGLELACERAGAALRTRRDALLECARRVRMLNDRNGILIENSLNRVTGSLAILLQGSLPQAPVYAADGRLRPTASGRIHTKA
jgi:flagella synthesis protein FlgN